MNQSSTRYEWNTVPWPKLEASVFKLQKRIYRASQRGDVKLVRRLQKLLLKSQNGKLLATKRVTQDNQGKKTPGIDGMAKLKREEKLRLAESLDLKEASKPVRRIWIPKPGKEEKRPLGIPIMRDRAKQALVKLALEPEWEAKFEPNSYGFRPGRSCHDTYEAIFNSLRRKKAYVLDADIAGCFDNIDHSALLKKLNTTPGIRRIIKGWLKSGVMEGLEFQSTERGTPQGGVISPLLANIALHGLENDTKKALAQELFDYMKRTRPKASNTLAPRKMSIIRYADDFVVVHEDLEVILKAKSFIETWLKEMGLEIKPSKTRITHTLEPIGEQKPGFDFLGFTVRQFPVRQSQKGYKLLMKPSRKAQEQHRNVIGEELRALRGAPQEKVIKTLNPIINGWSRYYVPAVSRKVFERLDHDTYGKLWQWATFRHPHKGIGWVRRKYFRQVGNDKWRFMTHQGMYLSRHSDHLIKRHVKVVGTRSPCDGDWVYWTTRLGKMPGTPPRVANLLKRQQGKCNKCAMCFRMEDDMRIEYVDRNPKNNQVENLRLVHQHCCNDTLDARCG